MIKVPLYNGIDDGRTKLQLTNAELEANGAVGTDSHFSFFHQQMCCPCHCSGLDRNLPGVDSLKFLMSTKSVGASFHLCNPQYRTVPKSHAGSS